MPIELIYTLILKTPHGDRTRAARPLRPANVATSAITVCRFLRLRGRGCVYAETCLYARGYVYAPAVYTHYRSRKRTLRWHLPAYTHPGVVYARTLRTVYAPTPAYKHVCVNAASGAYTHLPAYTHPTLRLRGDATNVM